MQNSKKRCKFWLTAAQSKLHLSGFSIFFFVASYDWQSTLIGQLASGAKYSPQISETFFWTSLCGRDFRSWTASQNLRNYKMIYKCDYYSCYKIYFKFSPLNSLSKNLTKCSCPIGSCSSSCKPKAHLFTLLADMSLACFSCSQSSGLSDIHGFGYSGATKKWS